MRTTIYENNKSMNELINRTESRTKTETIEIAIKEFLDKKALEDLISLNGKIDIDPDWQKDEAVEEKYEIFTLDNHFEKIPGVILNNPDLISIL